MELTYQETISWLFEQLPMYQRTGSAAYRKDLHNIKILSAYLNHPEKEFKSIHVGGTNGKGSCSHMIASILQEAGYKVGLYTSPHLKDFRERIRINGEMIPQSDVVRFIEKHKTFFEKENLSFFEMTVGLAFHTFAHEEVDIAVVEVGMGGRLDATNIITPELSIITNIGFDHMKFLGTSLSEIAGEKAGIIKPNIPVIIGERHNETEDVFVSKAKETSSPVYFAEDYNGKWFESDLKGIYQKKNKKTVLKAVDLLKQLNWKIEETHVKNGLNRVMKNTGLRGRWQTVGHKPLCIAETAHNMEGIQQATAQLKTYSYKTLRLVLGFVNDKDIASILQLFPKDAQYYFSSPNIPRAKSLKDLREELKDFDISKTFYPNLTLAYNAAKTDAHPKDFIYIGGSIFTVAELLP